MIDDALGISEHEKGNVMALATAPVPSADRSFHAVTWLDRVLFRPSVPDQRTVTSLISEAAPDELVLRAPPDGGVLVFDGYCGFCTRSALALRRLDRLDRVRALPLQAPRVLQLVGITREKALHEAYWVGADGVRRGGAGAMAEAFQAAADIPMVVPLYRLPGLRQAADRAYRWVAEHRRLLLGVTPYCEAFPAAGCAPDAGAACGCHLPHERRS